MQAVCQLAGPSSPPCKAEKVMEQEILHGQKGTFACPPLQPFTVYSVTISVPPSTILFTQHLRTKAMGNCPPIRSVKFALHSKIPTCDPIFLCFQCRRSRSSCSWMPARGLSGGRRCPPVEGRSLGTRYWSTAFRTQAAQQQVLYAELPWA